MTIAGKWWKWENYIELDNIVLERQTLLFLTHIWIWLVYLFTSSVPGWAMRGGSDGEGIVKKGPAEDGKSMAMCTDHSCLTKLILY